MHERYLNRTALLDFEDSRIEALVAERGWRDLPENERIGAIYGYVRNEVPFAYSVADDMPASAILACGYGQCNTKATLLMALLRACGVPCRFHGATVDKRLQKGIMDGLFYRMVPRDIVHTWAEVHIGDRWIGLEGVILDDAFLEGIRATVTRSGPVCSFAVGVADIANLEVEWRGSDTRVQSTAVNRDFGIFDDPDGFWSLHRRNERGLKGWMFQHRMRGVMNRKVQAIRAAGRTVAPV